MILHQAATQVMWSGGPLYVPSVSWDRENGTALFAHLVSARFATKKISDKKTALYNNMRSVTLPAQSACLATSKTTPAKY